MVTVPPRNARDLGVPHDLYPFTGKLFDHGDVLQHYLDEGEGEPVVMVHGNPTWSLYYRHLVLRLRDRYRCIVPDHVGCGLSDVPPDARYDYRLASRIDDLERLLAAVVPEGPVNLIVHDWGGMIGLGWAGRHPERIRRLVLMNTAAFHLPEHMRVPAPVALARDAPFAEWAVLGLNAFARGATHTCTTEAMPQRLRDAYCAPYGDWDRRLATLRFVQDIPLSAEDPSYATVSAVEHNLGRLRDKPALLAWGGRDFVFDDRVLTEWRHRFPRARVRHYHDAGHYVAEDEAEALPRDVDAFFDDSSGGWTEDLAGGPLCNVASCLPEIAERKPDGIAVRHPIGGSRYRERTYAELERASDRLAAGLQASGIGRGTRTAMMVPPGPELYTLSFALAKAGAVPIVIDPGIGLERMGACLERARPEALVAIPAAHAVARAGGWGRSTIHTRVVVGLPFPGAIRLVEVRRRGERQPSWAPAPTRAGDDAAILFTSGSTGPPKGAVYTHGNFDAQIRLLRQVAQIGDSEIDLPTFPVFALFDPALGMTSVLPDMDPRRPASVRPQAILDPIQRFGITNLFASPALLHRVATYGAAHDVQLPTLRRVVSAGAPVHREVMESFLSMLPLGARIVTPYGATEALPVAVVDSDVLLSPDVEALGADGWGICVGTVVPETQVRIIRITDGVIADAADMELLADGEVGEIVVRGPQVTARYVGDERATRLHKIADGDGFWHRMGDVGAFDPAGRLWFCGRKAHRLMTLDGPLFTVPAEVRMNGHEAVYRSALVGPRVAGRMVPTLVVERHRDERRGDRRQVHAELLELASGHRCSRAIEKVLFHDGLPVDVRHNAKIDRPALKRWAERRQR